MNLKTYIHEKKKHLSITYIDFPRKCDPLIYTYQSAQFIFFHEIFVNFSKFVFLFLFLFFFVFVLFFSFSIFSTFFFGLNMDKLKKKTKTKTKENNKQTNFTIFVNFGKFVFVLFFFFDI